MIWQGGLKGIYGVKKLSPPGHKNIVRTAHRALYICSARTLELPADMDVSHLCHTSLCVNIVHLVLESHIINMGRLECKNFGFCSLKHHPPCMFRVSCQSHKMNFFNFYESISQFCDPETWFECQKCLDTHHEQTCARHMSVLPNLETPAVGLSCNGLLPSCGNISHIFFFCFPSFWL